MRLPSLAHDEALGLYITIPQYWFNKTKQHISSTSEKAFSGVLGDFFGC